MSILDVFEKIDAALASRVKPAEPVPLENNEIEAYDGGRRLVYTQGAPITGGAPAARPGDMQSYALHQMIERELASGPSRSQNPRPAAQPERILLSEVLPQSEIDKAVEQAAAERSQINAENVAMIKSGAATVLERGARKDGRGAIDRDWSK